MIAEKIDSPGGPFGARWLGLSVPGGLYGIHGTNMPNSIGTYASHGCVRMFNEDVINLYNQVSIGTPVRIF
jgi:lipoprotein-anchoring transpeptidase ErfK/SrfK